MDFSKEKIYCQNCKKELGNITFTTYTSYFKGYTADNKRELFCNEKCYNDYWEQYFIETYKDNSIYMIIINGEKRYVPYIGCPYYFKTLEECRYRINQPNISINIGLY